MTDDPKIALGLFAIAKSIDGLTAAIHKLGVADAGTRMGAIEALAARLGTAIEELAECQVTAADRISDSLDTFGPVRIKLAD